MICVGSNVSETSLTGTKFKTALKSAPLPVPVFMRNSRMFVNQLPLLLTFTPTILQPRTIGLRSALPASIVSVEL